MRDALSNLSKLPPKCAATLEGRKVIIRRGGREPIPLHSPLTVDAWNLNHNVTPAQVQAMIVGVTLGWEMDGADPDTHAPEDERLGDGPFVYEYGASISIGIKVEARSEVEAAKQADALFIRAETLLDDQEWLQGTHCVEGSLELLNSTDPREL